MFEGIGIPWLTTSLSGYLRFLCLDLGEIKKVA